MDRAMLLVGGRCRAGSFGRLTLGQKGNEMGQPLAGIDTRPALIAAR